MLSRTHVYRTQGTVCLVDSGSLRMRACAGVRAYRTHPICCTCRVSIILPLVFHVLQPAGKQDPNMHRSAQHQLPSYLQVCNILPGLHKRACQACTPGSGKYTVKQHMARLARSPVLLILCGVLQCPYACDLPVGLDALPWSDGHIPAQHQQDTKKALNTDCGPSQQQSTAAACTHSCTVAACITGPKKRRLSLQV